MPSIRIPIENASTPAPVDAGSVWIVIAAYNEAPVIESVLQSLQEHYRNVVVVDDGSQDGTPEIVRRTHAHLVQHPINLGQGAALQTGIDFALRRGSRFIVTFDADGQHDPADIPLLLQALVNGGADIACGSRFLGRTYDMPRARRLFLKMAARFTSITSGVHMTDAHNGLRAMTHASATKLRIRQDRMAHASEIVQEIARKKLRLVEVPVTIRYTEYSLSKGQKLSHSIDILIDLLTRKLYR